MKCMFLTGFAVLCAGGVAEGQSFTALPGLPGAQHVFATAISADGQTIYGASAPLVVVRHPVRWEKSGAGWLAPTLMGIPQQSPVGLPLSALESGAVGFYMQVASPYARPAAWDGAGVVTPLPLPTGDFADARAVAGKGGVVVGYGLKSGPDGFTGIRWENGAIARTTPQFRLGAMSGDGSIAYGTRVSGAGREILRWMPDNSVASIATYPGLIGFELTAVSADASVMSLLELDKSFRWTESGGLLDLGVLPGHGGTFMRAMDASGELLAGRAEKVGGSTAVVWTPGGGLQAFGDFLAGHGISTSGWILQEVSAVSADGKTLVGYGRNPQSIGSGFVVTIPAPGAGALLALGVAIAGRRRR